jgi:hypothetical protein
MIPSNQIDRYWETQIGELLIELEESTQVESIIMTLPQTFVTLFRQIYIVKIPGGVSPDGKKGISRSNWTYHTALAFREAAELMGMDCLFEVEGKRDAVLMTRTDPAVVLLAAEWEWNPEDIFEEKKN